MIIYCLSYAHDLDNEVFGSAFRQYHYYYRSSSTTVLESTLLWSEESVEDVFSYESVLNYYEIESLLQNSFALFC